MVPVPMPANELQRLASLLRHRLLDSAPLLAVDGHALGTLCAIDHAPRAWSAREIALVRDLAFVTSTMIQSRAVEMDLAAMFQTCAARLAPQAA